MHWRRKWQPIPGFLPGESQGRGSLVGCCLRGRTESDTTESDLAAAEWNRDGRENNDLLRATWYYKMEYIFHGS